MDNVMMFESVRSFLSQFGKPEENVLRAISKVNRKNFMPDELEDVAYEDRAMPIGHGQTISQPSTVARMLQLLKLKEGENVLEVGTGSGWNAALIGFIVGRTGKVFGLEIIESLKEQAKKRIEKLGIENVVIENKDFRKLKQRFDKVIFTAGINLEDEKIIEDFAREHLSEEGILICPLRRGPLIVLKNQNGKIIKEYTKEGYVFVPLVL